MVNSLALIGLMGGAIFGIADYIDWYVTKYVLTTHRLITRANFFNRSRRQDPLEKIQSVISSEVLWTNFGSISVETAGNSSNIEIKSVDSLDYIEEAIASASNERKMKLGNLVNFEMG